MALIEIEQVGVIPSFLMDKLDKTKDHYISGLESAQIIDVIEEYMKFVDRTPELELNENYRQVIPYCIVYNRKMNKVLAATRTNKQGEARLHNKLSIGMGGHINPCDAKYVEGPDYALFECIHRELKEELGIDDLVRTIYQGVIYANQSPVDRVHLATVFLIVVDQDFDVTKESEKQVREWLTVEELKDRVLDMESWSQIAFDNVLNKDWCHTTIHGEQIGTEFVVKREKPAPDLQLKTPYPYTYCPNCNWVETGDYPFKEHLCPQCGKHKIKDFKAKA
jgi:predicted NUDIX family phosphoesterase